MTFDSQPLRSASAPVDPASILGAPASAPAATRADPGEAAIWRALTAGQHATAAELAFTTYRAALHRLARRMVRDTSTAEDVLQDAFLQILQGLHTVRTGTSVRAWVMAVVAHRALDELRRRGRRQRRLGDDVDAADLAGDAAQPAAALATHQEWRLVRACLAALAPEIRASIVLYFGQGLTFEQVGAILGEDGGAIRIRVARALPRLRGQLRRRGLERG